MRPGNRFTGSPELILKAGHWRLECIPTIWDYSVQAQINPFFRQVWEPIWADRQLPRYEREAYQDIMDAPQQ